MCQCNRFTNFCQLWLNWNKSRVWARCYFPFPVVILSRFLRVTYYRILGSETKGPHHTHSLRSRSFTKKPAFYVAGNLVKVVKFTFQSNLVPREPWERGWFQSVFGNSRQNTRHASARGREESVELYSILWLACALIRLTLPPILLSAPNQNRHATQATLWSDWPIKHQNKRFHVTEIVLPLGFAKFFGGREARTANTSAVRRLDNFRRLNIFAAERPKGASSNIIRI